jgi:hypothetical protein
LLQRVAAAAEAGKLRIDDELHLKADEDPPGVIKLRGVAHELLQISQQKNAKSASSSNCGHLGPR